MRPAFRITGLSALVESRVLSLSVTDESTEQSDSCSIEISDPRNEFEVPETGHVITVALGYTDKLRDMGQFVVDSVKLSGPANRITIDAKAAPFTAAGGFSPVQTRNTRSFDDITLGDIVRTIAGEHGLQPAVSPDLASSALAHVDQTNESDINFLTRLARQYRAVCKPTFGRLVFATRGEGKSITGLSLPSVTLTPADVISWSGTLSKRTEFAKVQTTYHDNETGETTTYDAESDQFTEGAQVYQHPIPYASQEEAEAAGASMLDQFVRGAQEVSVSMPGNPSLMAEATVTLSGFHPLLDVQWLIKRVEHSIGSGGFSTSFSCEVPGGQSGVNRKATKAAKAAKKGTSYGGPSVNFNAATNQLD
jgi:phage protein D